MRAQQPPDTCLQFLRHRSYVTGRLCAATPCRLDEGFDVSFYVSARTHDGLIARLFYAAPQPGTTNAPDIPLGRNAKKAT